MLGIVVLTCTMPASASVWGRLVCVLGAGFPLNRTTDQTPVGLLGREQARKLESVITDKRERGNLVTHC